MTATSVCRALALLASAGSWALSCIQTFAREVRSARLTAMVLQWLSKVLNAAGSALRNPAEGNGRHHAPGTAVHDSSSINSILGTHELLLVFDCLPASDVPSRAALVCKRW